MPLKKFFKDQFSLSNIASKLMWAVIFAGVVRAGTWLFGGQPSSELAYWLLVPASLFILAIGVSKLIGGASLPELDIHAEHMSFGTIELTIEGEKTKGAHILLFLSIRNRGVASAVSAYSLQLLHPSGQVFHGKRVAIPSGTLTVNNKTGTQTLEAADAIDKKTIVPVPQGGLAQGFILFAFPGIDVKLIQDPAATVRLRVIDGWRRECIHERKIGPLTAGKQLPFLPGVKVAGSVVSETQAESKPTDKEATSD